MTAETPPTGPTKPTQYRLTADTLADLDAIRAVRGLSSRAEAIRVAARDAVRADRKKSEKKPA